MPLTNVPANSPENTTHHYLPNSANVSENLVVSCLQICKEGGITMEKIIAYSVEELYEKVAEQEKRISEIEMRLGIKHPEDTSS